MEHNNLTRRSLLRKRERIAEPISLKSLEEIINDDSSFLGNVEEELVTTNNKSDELILDGEFDIQFSIIKQRTKTTPKFYVKFDLFTGKVIELTPVKIINKSIRYSVIEVEDTELINKLRKTKMALTKLNVLFNESTKKFELQQAKKSSTTRTTNALIFSQLNDDKSPIIIECDWVKKKIIVKFDSNNYKNYISNISSNEHVFFNKQFLVLFFVDAFDRTSLFSKIDVNFKELMLTQKMTFEADWLPDSETPIQVMHTPELGFSASINLSTESSEPSTEESTLKPQILYKQKESLLLLQSIMEKTDNYKLRNTINLFIHKHNDPGVLLGKITIDKERFDNFGSVNLIMNYKEKIKISTDHSHIYIEDNDVSTYYKF